MTRRKFLLGVGGVAAGGATLLGTGAFSRVESHRGVTIQVAEDPDAYLGLDECDSPHGDNYVDLDKNGHLKIDIGENQNGGDGVNSDSITWFDNVFEVCNQGKEDICLWIPKTDDWPEDDDGNLRVDFYFGEAAGEGDEGIQSIVGPENATQIELGTCECVGVRTYTKGLDATVDDKTLLEEIDDVITIVADVSSPTSNNANGANSANGTNPEGEIGMLGVGNPDTGGSFDEVTDLEDPDLEPEDLAEALVAEGIEDGDVEIVGGSVEYTGADPAGGLFEGTPNIIGFDDGLILSSGRVDDVVGPNESASTSTNFGTPGDEDLADLIDTNVDNTNDAAILEFEFDVPEDADEIFFNYVFGSDEYNEFVGSGFNDVFGFFLNGENVATVPDPDEPGEEIAAAINNINHGYDGFDPVNPDLYVNNDPFDGDDVEVDPEDPPGPGVGWDPATEDEPYDTEMDGFTSVLQVQAEVDPEENPQTLKLGVADVSDAIYDSWVLIEADTLAVDDPAPDPDPDPDPDPC